MKLFNTENAKELKQWLNQDTVKRITISFYKYHLIKNPPLFRDHLYTQFSNSGVLGRIYIATEGINAQISVPHSDFKKFMASLNDIIFLNDIRLNIAREDNGKSFFKLKVLVRQKIVADGIDDPEFSIDNRGKYLKAKEFNSLLEKEDTIVIDMRNHYESEIGHFKKAWTPNVDTFRDSLPYIVNKLENQKDKTVIMYCTGGIRCEKASAYMKHKGFDDVYHLEGGIIEYARQVEAENLDNKFIGKNFVFDERLSERIGNEIISNCHQCGSESDEHTNCLNEACHLLFIQCPDCKAKYVGCCSQECKEINSLPIEQQRALRKGKKTKRNIFKKGRSNLPFAPK
jgi:UPF0176 protein